jgi:hypothetical protein
MKLMRSLFQTVSLVITFVVLSQPLRADDSDPIKSDSPLVQPAPARQATPAHHKISMIFAMMESGFLGGVVPLAALLLAGRAISLAIPERNEEKVVEHQPVEVPPLRQLPERITIF